MVQVDKCSILYVPEVEAVVVDVVGGSVVSER